MTPSVEHLSLELDACLFLPAPILDDSALTSSILAVTLYGFCTLVRASLSFAMVTALGVFLDCLLLLPFLAPLPEFTLV